MHLPLTCPALVLPLINSKCLNSPMMKMWFECVELALGVISCWRICLGITTQGMHSPYSCLSVSYSYPPTFSSFHNVLHCSFITPHRSFLLQQFSKLHMYSVMGHYWVVWTCHNHLYWLPSIAVLLMYTGGYWEFMPWPEVGGGPWGLKKFSLRGHILWILMHLEIGLSQVNQIERLQAFWQYLNIFLGQILLPKTH